MTSLLSAFGLGFATCILVVMIVIVWAVHKGK